MHRKTMFNSDFYANIFKDQSEIAMPLYWLDMWGEIEDGDAKDVRHVLRSVLYLLCGIYEGLSPFNPELNVL